MTGAKIELPRVRGVSERDLLEPLGDPKRTPDFYELVALQHGRLTALGDQNPSATMAEIGDVAQSTAQGWVAKARARGCCSRRAAGDGLARPRHRIGGA